MVQVGWDDPEAWDVMWRGFACPMCADIGLPTNTFSLLVAELRQSYVRLGRNQYRRGYTVVALKRHANELFELSASELAGFWQDVADAAQAVQSVFGPVKMNYAVLGNICPHVHCHLLPQYRDQASRSVLDMQEREVLLSDGEYAGLIEQLRAALGRLP